MNHECEALRACHALSSEHLSVSLFESSSIQQFSSLDPVHLSCADQYAFRPTGSTTAAIGAILQAVTELLSYNSYVVVITLDFSKAFDTVRHSTLLDKMASMNIPDDV